MKHAAEGKGAWGGQIAMSIDEIESHCEPVFVAKRKTQPGDMKYEGG
jgi:hypothetical protein